MEALAQGGTVVDRDPRYPECRATEDAVLEAKHKYGVNPAGRSTIAAYTKLLVDCRKDAEPVARMRDELKLLKAKREAKRQADERERQAVMEDRRQQRAAEVKAQEIAKQEKEALQAKRRLDPEWMSPTWSAVICYSAGVRSRALKEIAKEKHYAREGAGIVNKAKLYDLQTAMRAADESSAQARVALKDLKTKPMPCTSGSISRLRGCMEDASDDGCQTPEVTERLELVAIPDNVE
jgi:hypothetical protein